MKIEHLRRQAIRRSLFKPVPLPEAIERLGFVQADPMRAPARAQDLILMHRARRYRAGELEERYPQLAVEEDCFVNYGFVPRAWLGWMHPRTPRRSWDAATGQMADEILAHVRQQGEPTHPQAVEDALQHGRMTGYWGNDQRVSSHLLDGLHYRGHLRVAARQNGTRLYEPAHHPDPTLPPAERAWLLLEKIVQLYAPLPQRSLSQLASMLRYGAPHLQTQVKTHLAQAKALFEHAEVDGETWYWPAGESPQDCWQDGPSGLYLLAPFDPVVWDRLRFERFWRWPYRFEAYTPAAKRKMGHYALPLLWKDEIRAFANVKVQAAPGLAPRMAVELGHADAVAPVPRIERTTAFEDALDKALRRMADFLDVPLGEVRWRA